MIRRRIKMAAALAVLAAAGALAGLLLAPAAFGWSPTDLPPGWSVDHIQSPGAATCPSAYRIRTATAGVFSDPLCEDSPTYQSDFDAYVNAHYTPPPSAPATTTTPATTTAAAPTTTTTTTATPAPAPAPAPPSTDTTSTAAATTTSTTTSTVDATLVSLQAQLDQLTAQLAALTDRVARVEKAGDAAWLAFEQATEQGMSPAAAADQARGTYLNAIYQLGAFAP